MFGTNAEFPPFEFVASNGVIGEFDGIDIAIADQIAKDNGMVAEIANMEFDSLLIALENGQVDAVIAGMTVTEERLEAVDFSTPYYLATQVMIVKEDSAIAKATDMADKTIAVIQGYTGEVCVKEMGYEYVEFAGYYNKSAEEIKSILDKYGLKCISVHQSVDFFDEEPDAKAEFLKTFGVKYSVIPGCGPENYETHTFQQITDYVFVGEINGKMGLFDYENNAIIDFIINRRLTHADRIDQQGIPPPAGPCIHRKLGTEFHPRL